jgi:hypothetical protein
MHSKAEVPRETCRWDGSIGYFGGSVRSLSVMSGREFVVVLVGGGVEAFVLACEVIAPVGVEVAVVDESAELEDGFGAGQAPAAAGDVEAVADQVAAGAFDRAGGDGPARAERGVVTEVVKVPGEVADAGRRLPRAGFRAALSDRPER